MHALSFLFLFQIVAFAFAAKSDSKPLPAPIPPTASSSRHAPGLAKRDNCNVTIAHEITGTTWSDRDRILEKKGGGVIDFSVYSDTYVNGIAYSLRYPDGWDDVYVRGSIIGDRQRYLRPTADDPLIRIEMDLSAPDCALGISWIQATLQSGLRITGGTESRDIGARYIFAPPPGQSRIEWFEGSIGNAGWIESFAVKYA